MKNEIADKNNEIIKSNLEIIELLKTLEKVPPELVIMLLESHNNTLDNFNSYIRIKH